MDYAWDEPGRTRKLRCELDGAHGAALREPATHTYTLDEIKVGPPPPCLVTHSQRNNMSGQSCISTTSISYVKQQVIRMHTSFEFHEADMQVDLALHARRKSALLEMLLWLFVWWFSVLQFFGRCHLRALVILYMHMAQGHLGPVAIALGAA